MLCEPLLLDACRRRLVAAGLYPDSEAEALNFFALARYTRRHKATNPVGLFHSFLDGSYLDKRRPDKKLGRKLTWRESISKDDEDWGREAFKRANGEVMRPPGQISGPLAAEIGEREMRAAQAYDEAVAESEHEACRRDQLARLETWMAKEGTQ